MKLKFLFSHLVAVLLLTACARETYYFPKVGDPYGSHYKKKAPVAASNESQEKAVTAADLLTQSTRAKEVAALVASTHHITTTTAKAKIQPLKTIAGAKKITKIAQLKAALKVKKDVKAIIKAAEKKEKATVPADAAETGKSQLIAAILAFFVGALGIHRFYLGYTGIGIAQILTLGGCGIWALIDLIRILMGDLKPKGGEYSETLDDL
ncbi:TM2 domain-containing protein [Adhaeribacter pallidiroseus]|uniref:TM2 domain-containing protein n=1 Tax=Adhaeribacter pallidiroseus TaxID=2072847 RepID=A0A369QP19_9BACT|nr:TM2 domain-containing protein [Adhaeribacter pallidiroseus]RDC66474.1 TM2 domain-containing protein [Adhaeribacter pallidiroseus]